MSRLVETIKSDNGILQNISFHNERMFRSLYEVFRIKKENNLESIIAVPQFALNGTYKCRVVYDDINIEIAFQPYNISPVKSLKIVEANDISYPHKFTDRENINKLFEQREQCDDILIIKNGRITDTSYTNVILKDPDGQWVTPSSCLLAGTRRASLLHRKEISEADITLNDLHKYLEIRLINAMIGIDDTTGIPISHICL
jgi:4-amino-4-deoxychorismate lyase